MSCLHITGTQREGADVPLVFTSPPVTERTLKRLEILSESPNPGIRASAAASYQSSSGILGRLAKDSDESVRISVARNATTPTDVLDRLAFDPSPTVRAHVALNRNCTSKTLDLLSSDPDARVANMSHLMRVK